MKWMQEQRKHENLTYLALWSMLFAVPVLSLYVRTLNNDDITFRWGEVLMIWQRFAVFLAIFLVHNYLLAPLLVYRNKRVLYCCSIAVVLGVFVTFQCTNRPPEHLLHPTEKMETADHPRPPMDDADGFGPQHHPNRQFHHQPRHRHHPPVVFGEHDIVAFIILVLMLGMNLGIKYYFKSRHDAKQLIALEKENLEQQLEYLKYQINPHFFMNTLNNIHALVDIDPEKAKDTILELSKMMRFILYEGDKKGVPLTREFDFIRHYVTLMRMRYTDKVEVRVDLPTEVPDHQLPPLMLITFIENAFKHGISYSHPSFIHVKVGIEGTKLRFECYNSKADKPNEEKGGVGLTNVKQRLNLIYGTNYTLTIQDEPESYNVELVIPLT